MRTNLLGMCSAVAAVAVAGSANASMVFDNFQAALSTSATSSNSPTQTTFGFGGWGSSIPAFAAGSRLQIATGYTAGTPEQVSQVIVGGGTATLNVGQTGDFTSEMRYNVTSTLAPADLTNYVFSITVSSVSGTGATLGMGLSDGGTVARALTGAGTYTFAVSDFSGPSFNPASISTVTLALRTGFAADGATTASVTLTSFTYSIVPAPGGIALLGAASLMARRRRN